MRIDDPRRPFPFTSSHEWVDECESSCPYNHPGCQEDPTGRHCRKCGIAMSMALSRERDIDIEACPIRNIGRCRRCERLGPITMESSVDVSICHTCLHPHVFHASSVTGAIAAMLNINAGMTPDPPGDPEGGKPS